MAYPDPPSAHERYVQFLESPVWERRREWIERQGNAAATLTSLSLRAVWTAAERYEEKRSDDPDLKPVAFGKVAEAYVRKAVMDGLRREQPGGPLRGARLRELADQVDRTAQVLGRTPTSREVAEAVGIDVKEVWETQQLAVLEGVDLGLRDAVALHADHVDAVEPHYPRLAAEEVAEQSLHDQWEVSDRLDTLTKPRREMVRRRYLDGATRAEVAEERDTSVFNVDQTVKKAMGQLRTEAGMGQADAKPEQPSQAAAATVAVDSAVWRIVTQRAEQAGLSRAQVLSAALVDAAEDPARLAIFSGRQEAGEAEISPGPKVRVPLSEGEADLLLQLARYGETPREETAVAALRALRAASVADEPVSVLGEAGVTRQAGDVRTRATEHLVTNNLGLVNAIAGKASNQFARLPSSEAPAERRADGRVGLHQAAERYDPDKGKFATFASVRVSGAVVDGRRSSDPVGRGTREKVARVRVVTDGLTQQLGRRPSQAEIADATGMTEGGLDALAQIAQRSQVEKGSPQVENMADVNEAEPGLDVDLADIPLDRLTDRQRQVVEGYDLKGKTFAAIGEELGITESGAFLSRKKGLAVLRRSMEAAKDRDKAAPPSPSGDATPVVGLRNAPVGPLSGRRDEQTPDARSIPAPMPPPQPALPPRVEAPPLTGSIGANPSATARRRTAQVGSVAQLPAETRQSRQPEDHDTTRGSGENPAAPARRVDETLSKARTSASRGGDQGGRAIDPEPGRRDLAQLQADQREERYLQRQAEKGEPPADAPTSSEARRLSPPTRPNVIEVPSGRVVAGPPGSDRPSGSRGKSATQGGASQAR